MAGTRNLKIAIDIRGLDTEYITGVDTYLRRLLECFKADSGGHTFVLFGTKKLRDLPLVKSLVGKGHEFIEQPWPNKIFNSLMRFCNWPPLDNLVKADVFFLPHPMFHAFSPEAKTVVTFHDLSFEKLKRIYSWKHNLWHVLVNPKAEAQKAQKVIAVSESTAQDLRNIYKIAAEKVKVIPLGVNFEEFNQSSTNKLSLPKQYILFLGSIEPRKNVYSLIRAFNSISPKHPGLHLVLAGSFFPQKDKRVFSERNDKIIYLGQVKEEDKPELYQRARVFAFPSIYEGFGLQVLESMAAGTPVVTSSGSSMPEVAKGAALLVNPLNIEELSQALDQLLVNENLRHNLVSKGREIAKSMPWQETARKTLEVLQQI